MYRLALCDNCREDLDTLRKQTNAWQLSRSTIETQLVCFDSAARLRQTLSSHFYDLYVLDILMPGISGIDLGREIRSQDRTVPIIYTTTSKEFALAAYDVKACQYLLKPLRQEAVNEALDYACRMREERQMHPVSLHSGQGLVTVAREDIMYIENVVRTSNYVLKDGREISETRRGGRFEDAVRETAQDDAFVQTHKSYFVNMAYISSLTSNCIVMDNGTHIPVNRRRADEVETKYLIFVSREGSRK